MRDIITCAICGGNMESYDGDRYACDTCDYTIGGDGYDYTDLIGGRHSDGVGWNPNGVFCGECVRKTCEGCSILKGDEDRHGKV